MEITDDNVVEEAAKLVDSGTLIPYIDSIWHGRTDYDRIAETTGFDIRVDKVTDLESAKNFCEWCQHLWVFLPDSPHIRHGAFFQICDFAEYYVWGQYA